jgi:hypothetical protein
MNTALMTILFEKIVAALNRAAILSKENEKELKELKKDVLLMMNSVLDEDDKIIDFSEGDDIDPQKYFSKCLRNKLFIDNKLEFGGNQFNSVTTVGRTSAYKDGRLIKTSCDILLENNDVVCIIDTEFRAKKYHIDEVLEMVGMFRVHFKPYANHKIHLGIGALSFDEGVEDAAKERGIGIMKQNGDAVVVYDKDLKVY